MVDQKTAQELLNDAADKRRDQTLNPIHRFPKTLQGPRGDESDMNYRIKKYDEAWGLQCSACKRSLLTLGAEVTGSALTAPCP